MTNQFTDEQIEAAVKAVANEHAERGDACGPAGFARVARAALEAAAGAAPQAESVPTSKHISPHLPSMIRNLWKSDPSENSVRTALKLAGDLIQELIDLRAANMLREPGVPDWEYVGMAFEHGGFMRIRNDQLVPEKFDSWWKLMAQYPRVEILKRVKAVPAGPWLPVEGESK